MRLFSGCGCEVEHGAVQVWVGVPGRARFSLQRLHGAPHGLPGLALRQVQVIRPYRVTV